MVMRLSFILISIVEDMKRLLVNAARVNMAPLLVHVAIQLGSSAEIVSYSYHCLNITDNFFLDCSNFDVRLVGGPTGYEGILQVCYYNTWGLVSANGWTDREASVVCKQLNYNTSSNQFAWCCVYCTMIGSFAVNGSRYEASRRTIQLINVACTRNEEELDQCDKRLLTPAEGVALNGRVSIAGVKCEIASETVQGASSAQSSGSSMVYVTVGSINIIIVVLILIIARYLKNTSCITITIYFLILSVQLYVS